VGDPRSSIAAPGISQELDRNRDIVELLPIDDIERRKLIVVSDHYPSVAEQESTDQLCTVRPCGLLNDDPVELLAIGDHFLDYVR
jgi:hypothetical protein